MNENDTLLVNDEIHNDGDDELKELYYKLGRAYYEGSFEDPLPQLLPLFDRITAIHNRNKIEKTNSASDTEIKVCANCGKELPRGAVFCGSCGTKVE